MSGKPFDATLKGLIEQDALGWARQFGGGGVRSVSLLDADLSTVTAAADKVLRVESDAGPFLLDLEPEARHAADAPDRMLLYSTVLRHRHQLPVRSVLLLLRREANASNLTGELRLSHPGETAPYLTFRYGVVRLWQEPLRPLLEGSLGTLPLAPLTDEGALDLRGTVHQLDQRLRSEAPPALADTMRAATFVLMGLRYEVAIATQLAAEISTMEESVTYQWIVAKGRPQGARHLLLRMGRVKLGEPDEATRAAIESMTDLDRIEQLGERLLSVNSWQELLSSP